MPPPQAASKKRLTLVQKAPPPPPKKKKPQAPKGKKAATKKLSYEKTQEELDASVASDVKAHFEKVKRDSQAKRNPKPPYWYLPKGEVRKKVDEANRKMHKLRKRGPLSDYERQLLKAMKAPPAKKKAGKSVLGLGETSRPLSPLILPNQYGSNMGRVHRKFGDTTLSDYEVENYFLESGLPIETIVGIAAGLEFPRAEVVDEWRRNFELSRSLMNPKHLHVLGT